MTDLLRTITATPAGTKADGSRIDRVNTYELVREPEDDFGRAGVSRIWHRVTADPRLRRDYDVHVTVVVTDSIATVYTEPGTGLTFEIAHGMAFYTTACCGASGKGSGDSETGVVCRACYQDVDGIYGTGPSADTLAAMADVPRDAVEQARKNDALMAGLGRRR